MDCPKCGGPLQPGRAVVERSPGDWATVGLWLFADVGAGGFLLVL
jgi:hypothetical protein